MRRVINIGGVPIENSLFISSEFDADNYIGSRSVAIDGSSIMFIQPKGAMTKEVSIYSKDSGWVHKNEKDLLLALVNENPITITFSDTSTALYYFDHTKVPMLFTALYAGSDWFTIDIKLLKA